MVLRANTEAEALFMPLGDSDSGSNVRSSLSPWLVPPSTTAHPTFRDGTQSAPMRVKGGILRVHTGASMYVIVHALLYLVVYAHTRAHTRALSLSRDPCASFAVLSASTFLG